MALPIEKLTTDLNSPEFLHGTGQRFWELVEQSGMVIFICLYAADKRGYIARFDCDSYGAEPIACRFVDTATRQCVASAWPQGNSTFEQWVKFREGNLFICWDQDRLGISHHPDWRCRKAWSKHPNQIVSYLDFLRRLLHLPILGYLQQTPPHHA